MIEVYVLAVMSTIGYLVNKMSGSDTVVTPVRRSPKDSAAPSMTNLYEGNQVEKDRRAEHAAVARSHARSQTPMTTRVIGRSFGIDGAGNSMTVPSLSGTVIPRESFTHSNMVPFFGGRMKQNMTSDANSTLLESFTGSGASVPHVDKVEVLSFSDTSKSVGNVTGMPNHDEFYRDRVDIPKARNNDFPISAVHVGPGLNQAFTAGPTGGFQQIDTRQFEYDPDISDLRTKLNPNHRTAIGMSDNQQVSYAARIVDGQREKLPANAADVGRVQKNRSETFHAQTPAQLLKSTVQGWLKPSLPQNHLVKDTSRQATTREYTGSAFTANARTGLSTAPSMQPPSRTQLRATDVANASLSQYGRGQDDDFGKANIRLFTNSKRVLSSKVYQGTLVSVVKAITTPILDALRPSKKSITVKTFRRFGNSTAHHARKPTLRPDDALRTTLKETGLRDTFSNGNVGTTARSRVAVRDPHDLPRTTVKETALFDEFGFGSVGNGARKLAVQDPNEVCRSTTREGTSMDGFGFGHIDAVPRRSVRDPDDTLRPTVKETTLHDESGTGNVNTGVRKRTVHDTDDVFRTTVKETALFDEYGMGSVDSGARKRPVHDPGDVLRTTVKETSLFDESGTGSFVSRARRRPVHDPDDVFKTTVKETSSFDEFGMGSIESRVRMRPTHDPDDVLRTTVKETSMFDEFGMGSVDSRVRMLPTHDPNDVMRTTVKETSLFDEYGMGSVDSRTRKRAVRDPDDTLRTTVKETSLFDEYGMGSVGSGVHRRAVQDPDDTLRTTVKETSLFDEYGMGSVNSGARKRAVQDPDDVFRTTVKETSMCDEYGAGSMGGGVKKRTVHDPEDRLRTTVKETAMFDVYGRGSVDARVRGRSMSSDDLPRTTVKETSLHDEFGTGMMSRALLKATVVDANNVARTTIKETTIHDDTGRGTLTGARQLCVYDPVAVAKETIRQTLERQAYELNFKSSLKRGVVRDPRDTARNTVKETTLRSEFGNIDSVRGGSGAYKTTNYMAKPTLKQNTSDNDRIGGAGRDAGGGYVTNVKVAKPVKRQFIADNDYFGDAVSTTKQPTSLTEYQNARTSVRQESILKGRIPTTSGPKRGCASQTYGNVSTSKMPLQHRPHDSHDRMISDSRIPAVDNNFTKIRNMYEQYDAARLDPAMLDSLRSNPFAIDITK